MAEGPSTAPTPSPPDRLDIRGPSVYQDENERTWVPDFSETGGGPLRVRFRQEDIPRGYIVLASPMPTTSMPWVWVLHPDSCYLDSLCQFWRIVSHAWVDGHEEMLLELLSGS